MHGETWEQRRNGEITKEADTIEQNRLMGINRYTETRQLGCILKWRPLVLSMWPEAMLSRIEAAGSGLRGHVTPPVALLKFSFITKSILCSSKTKANFKGTGIKSKV